MSVAHSHPRLMRHGEISLCNAVGYDASCLASCPPAFPPPRGGRVQEVPGTSRALREACWTADNGGASGRWPPTLRTISAANVVILMNAVGFWVGFLSHPINGLPVVSTWTRRVRSTRGHSSRASNQTSPKASIRSGFVRHRRLTMTGAFKKATGCSTPCCPGSRGSGRVREFFDEARLKPMSSR